MLLSACAQITQPQGGPKDETPPVLLKEASTPNFQRNWKKGPIEMTFNEWVQLKDVNNQVIVTPPLVNLPQMRIKKKTVIFEFDEEETLRPNATYIINFGEAIQDLTEGNPVPNLRYVFSTGSKIDSLEIKATVVDATTKSPVKDVLVMVYDNLEDSVVRKEPPLYFAKTDEAGRATIRNIRADTFKVFALLDKNLRYIFDSDEEQIGFQEAPVILTDSNEVVVNLEIFLEEPRQSIKSKKVDEYGQLELIFAKEASSIDLGYQEIGQQVSIEQSNDTILVWYDIPAQTNWQLYVPLDSSRTDTLRIRPRGRADFIKKSKLTLIAQGPQEDLPLSPFYPLRLRFNHPLTQIDTSLIELLEDSVKVSADTLQIDSSQQRILLLNYPWRSGAQYELNFLPNALTDIYGLRLQDSLRQSYIAQSKEDFGNLKLKVEDIDSTRQYVVQLLNSKKRQIDEFVIQKKSSFEVDVPNLPPGIYTVRVIDDRNANGRKDTGNYERKEQPEREMSKALEELRANWEVEATILVRENLEESDSK